MRRSWRSTGRTGMRELSPWAKRSNGREAHRAFYASYMRSPAWWQRRHRWVEEESVLLQSGQSINCAGCGEPWRLSRDDLHHVSYDRLGAEHHDDLWPMCRHCHTALHDLLASTPSWRKLSRELANQLALGVLLDIRDGYSARPVPKGAAAALGEFL